MRQTRAQADIFKALGHPVRLRILAAIQQGGEACVCHLEHDLGLRQAYLSQHLAKLRAAGLVKDRRVGSNVFYALVGDWVPQLLATAGEAGFAAPASRRPGGRPRPRRACPCPRCLEKDSSSIRKRGSRTSASVSA
ncbi:MAG TPA: metalloregulator ArsR/SmtB family transcription factor [Anaerolineales bacterium]|nr:metalloregulator ArsR/SmtB family transcription factor [Anaerolineales bacterium]